MRRWLGLTQRTPGHTRPVILQSGTDEFILDEPAEGTIFDYVSPGLIHETVTLEDNQTYDLLSTDGSYYGPPGSPILPTNGQFIAIPRSCKLERIETIAVEFEILEETFSLPPHPQPTKDGELLRYIKDEEVYGKDVAYPQDWFVDMGQRTVSDVKVWHIVIFNAKINPVTGVVLGLVNLTLRFVYNEAGFETGVRKPRPNRCSSMVLDIARVLHYDTKKISAV